MQYAICKWGVPALHVKFACLLDTVLGLIDMEGVDCMTCPVYRYSKMVFVFVFVFLWKIKQVASNMLWYLAKQSRCHMVLRFDD